MTYYDRLNAFFRNNEIDPLPPSAQLLYLHLLHENNRLQNPCRFRLSESRLADMTGLSRQTIANAKRALKNRGLIEVNVSPSNPRAGSFYILPDTAEPTKKQNTESDGRQVETNDADISAELKKTWTWNNDGTPPNETEAYYLADDVKLYGEEKVRQAIIRAGQKKRGSLSVYFYKMQLGNLTSGKEGAGNARRNAGGNSQTVSERGLYGRGEDTAPEL